MLSPYISLKNDCDLCEKLKSALRNPDFLFDAGHTMYVFKSPFAEKWPGALMPVFKRHICEHSDIRGVDLPDSFHTLVCLEKAIRKVTNCRRVNVVKFGNVNHHLHWHIIPRYANERYPSKCSWELKEHQKEDLYKHFKNNFFSNDNPIYPLLVEEALYEIRHRSSAYFGCALFLRPIKESLRSKILDMDLDKIAEMVRKNPENWDCLLMKRNYFDFAWDFIGGNCDINEFPEQAMIREVHEEVGWKIKKYKEISRQWRMGAVKGFVYLAIPDNAKYMEDSPPRVLCQEVQTVEYFNIMKVLNDEIFSDSVRGRLKAFLENKSDFISIDG